jgi:hypothetical protein
MHSLALDSSMSASLDLRIGNPRAATHCVSQIYSVFDKFRSFATVAHFLCMNISAAPLPALLERDGFHPAA